MNITQNIMDLYQCDGGEKHQGSESLWSSASSAQVKSQNNNNGWGERCAKKRGELEGPPSS